MLLIYISAIYLIFSLHTSRFDQFEDDFWYVLEIGRINPHNRSECSACDLLHLDGFFIPVV